MLLLVLATVAVFAIISGLGLAALVAGFTDDEDNDEGEMK